MRQVAFAFSIYALILNLCQTLASQMKLVARRCLIHTCCKKNEKRTGLHHLSSLHETFSHDLVILWTTALLILKRPPTRWLQAKLFIQWANRARWKKHVWSCYSQFASFRFCYCCYHITFLTFRAVVPTLGVNITNLEVIRLFMAKNNKKNKCIIVSFEAEQVGNHWFLEDCCTYQNVTPYSGEIKNCWACIHQTMYF